jgi:Methyltransferase domain
MLIVNFGCGSAAGQDCLNLDGSPTVLLAKLPIPTKFFGPRAAFVAAVRDYDIGFRTARRLHFAAQSLDGFYTSHTLEHLDRADCENLLARVKNWLKPGGFLRAVLPDFKSLACAYVSGAINADEFISKSCLRGRKPRHSPFVLGYGEHRWMYDYDSFAALLKSLGYQEVRRSSFANSALPQLAALDLEARKEGSFYVEACR